MQNITQLQSSPECCTSSLSALSTNIELLIFSYSAFISWNGSLCLTPHIYSFSAVKTTPTTHKILKKKLSGVLNHSFKCKCLKIWLYIILWYSISINEPAPESFYTATFFRSFKKFNNVRYPMTSSKHGKVAFVAIKCLTSLS